MSIPGYADLADRLTARGIDVPGVELLVAAQEIELPSWAFGSFGTRFATFRHAGQARDVWERIADAAEVQRLLGACPAVALILPWDAVDDYGELTSYAADRNLRIGTVLPNLFQEDDYRLGSVCHPSSAVRRKAAAHLLECAEVAGAIGSGSLSIWLADGTNYAGQDSFVERRERLIECLAEVYRQMPAHLDMLVEYKFFEPSFYHTDLADWGLSLLVCQALGDHAKVLVDLGHHALGTNVEHIVATLASIGRLGGFHFNNRKYADDDLIVGSVNPLELFLVYCELVNAGARAKAPLTIRYMLDQCHNIEDNIEALIVSVVNLQHAYAKALIVDRDALRAAQQEGNVIEAHRLVMDAYETDVRPLVANVRVQRGAAAEPLTEYRASGYGRAIIAERPLGA